LYNDQVIAIHVCGHNHIPLTCALSWNRSKAQLLIAIRAGVGDDGLHHVWRFKGVVRRIPSAKEEVI
jgi:hypothetical protein